MEGACREEVDEGAYGWDGVNDADVMCSSVVPLGTAKPFTCFLVVARSGTGEDTHVMQSWRASQRRFLCNFKQLKASAPLSHFF